MFGVNRRCNAFTVPCLIPANTDFGGDVTVLVGSFDGSVRLADEAVNGSVLSAVFWKNTFNDRTVPGGIESILGSLCRPLSVLGNETKLLVDLDAETVEWAVSATGKK